MKKEMRVGIVGCGGIARCHVNAYKNSKRARLVSVFDLHRPAAEGLAKETGARVAASIGEMVEMDQLDGVSICTPPAVHYDNCRPFVENGVGVLCEKPMEVNAVRGAKLAALARKHRAVVMVAFCHRFHPEVAELRRLIDKGILGKPVFFRNIFAGYISFKGNHRANPKLSGGGCLIDNGTHAVDIFRYLVGEPTAVQAMAADVMQHLPIEDFGMIQLSVKDKVFGEITTGFSLKNAGAWVEWFGTKGSARISYWNPGQPNLAIMRDGDKEWKAVDCGKRPDRFAGEIQHFLDCVETGRKPSPGAEDGVQVCRVLDAAYKAAATGKRVKVQAKG
ncbi:MAG: Gfo/Idh/MocA family oxidoreductase [Verrucomicrobiae bacterium]|nr:Gfo/Idh/MocA family oxidoreductase [Verrucomicrobiae bacterium]